MRFLAIDYGDSRTGLALGDDVTGIVSPIEVLDLQNERLIAAVGKLMRKYEPDAVVIGLPLNMDGTEGPQVKKVRLFSDKICHAFQIPLFFQDERLSSSAAEEKLAQRGLTHGGKKTRRDALAACEFLDDFLKARRGH